MDFKMYTYPTTQKNITCFAPNQVLTHEVRISKLININVLFRARLHLQWIKEQEINMFFCDSVSLCSQRCLFGSVLRERYIFKHLIAS